MVVSNDGGGHVDNSGGGDCINDTDGRCIDNTGGHCINDADSGVVMAIGDAGVDDAGEVVVVVVVTGGDGHWGGGYRHGYCWWWLHHQGSSGGGCIVDAGQCMVRWKMKRVGTRDLEKPLECVCICVSDHIHKLNYQHFLVNKIIYTNQTTNYN